MSQTQPAIRFAVLTNGRSLKKWQAEAVKKLTESGLCQCVLYISNPDSADHKRRFLPKIFKRDALFTFLTNRIFRVPAEENVPIPEGVEMIEAEVVEQGFSQYFADEDLRKIKSAEPHFILRFGYNILRGDILEAAPYGIWSFHHGDERQFRGGPFGFWEIVKKVPSTGVILQRLTSKLDAGHVLERRAYITVFHSWKEMRQRLLCENADLPLLAVKRYIIHHQSVPNCSRTKAPIYKTPGFFRMTWFMWCLWTNRVAFYYRRHFLSEVWQIESGRVFQSPLIPLVPAVHRVQAQNRRTFYADPFILNREGQIQVFFEHYSYKKQHGSIAIFEPGKNIIDWKSEQTHLAYPSVFEHEGRNWIIPEQAASGVCTAYEINQSNTVVGEVRLLDAAAIDPTMVFHEGKFYLFCGLKDQLPNEKLFIFWSDSFEGPYQPHHLNPVKVDPVGTRSGGNLIKWQDSLYRPAQVFEFYYGRKIFINKIIHLSPDLFNEVLNHELNPATFGSEYHGLHTYTVSGDTYAVDLKRHRFGLSAFWFGWNQRKRKGGKHV